MWEMEKKYPRRPETEEAWTEIIKTAVKLCEELELKQGCYERILIAEFMRAKERAKE
jgi:hypothetical protein